jgi:hypothetical protein
VISEQVTQLKQGCQLILTEVESADEDDSLKAKLPEFYSSAQIEVTALEHDVKVCNIYQQRTLSAQKSEY